VVEWIEQHAADQAG